MRGAVVMAFCLVAGTSAGCAAPVQGVAANYNLSRKGVALDGYDAVSYIDNGAAVEGDFAIAHVYEGATYLFASQDNRARFASDPERYKPAWGGWCAWAVSHDGTFGVDPDSFLVRDGRLFLFHDSIFFDARSAWLQQDEQRLIASGDAYWSRIVGPPTVSE